MADIIRKHIIFHGSVQGVGFRYYSEHKANQLRLTGWVKNLYNGDVEMEVQGSEAAMSWSHSSPDDASSRSQEWMSKSWMWWKRNENLRLINLLFLVNVCSKINLYWRG